MQQNLQILSTAVNEWMQEPRPVSEAPPAAELQKRLDLGLSESPSDWQQIEESVKAYLKYNPDVSSPGFNKLLYSGLNKPALLGDWITSLSNATMHTYQVGPVATLMELELIKQFNQLIGFDQGDGVMVSGGSQANLISMLLARHKACPEFKTKGADGRRLVAYVSDQAHYSSLKATNVLGIGSDNLVAVETDDQGRLKPEALRAAIVASKEQGHTPFYIALTAGTTVVGAYDPVVSCREIADEFDLWLHIDGAWGAPVLFSEQHRPLLEGSHLADSFTWDAHKLMNVPVTAGVILVKEAGLLKECCSGGGSDYLFHSDENAAFNLGERSIQCGRRADALKVWLSWKAIGTQGFADKIDYLQQQKNHLLQQVENEECLELLAPAAYLNVLFRFKPESINDEEVLRQLNVKICKRMMSEGKTYTDYAQYKGRYGIRLILANSEITHDYLDRLLRDIKQTGENILAEEF